MSMYRRVLVVVMVVAMLAASDAMLVGAVGPAEVTIAQVDASAYPDAPVKIYVSVQDAQGSPLTTLTQDAFRLSVDGQPLAIKGMTVGNSTTVSAPSQLVLAMDTSVSMSGAPMDKARAAAIQFVEQLRGAQSSKLSHTVSIWQFDDKPKQVVTFTNNTNSLIEGLGSLKAGTGRTALYDTLFTISRVVQTRPGRRALIVVTQGNNDSSSEGNIKGAIQAAVDAHAPAYMLGFGSVDDENLTIIARETGGEFLKEPAADDVGKLFEKLMALLVNQYALEVELPLSMLDGKDHSFAVSLQSGGKKIDSPQMKLAIAQVDPMRMKTAIAKRSTPTSSATVSPTATPITRDRDTGGTSLPLILGLLALVAGIAYMMRPAKASIGPRPIGPIGPTVVDTPDIYPPDSAAGTASDLGNNDFSSFSINPGPSGGAHGGTVILRPVAKALLNGENGPSAGQQLEMLAKEGMVDQPGQDTWEIGREGPQDMVLIDAAVSRRHCKIRWEWEGHGRQRKGRFVVHDLAASNPVEVNGQIVVSQALKDGDRIKIGATTFVFKQFDLRLPGAGH
ncbi:MAG TPA: VWA domain-containing protein [Anaerolineae bacterium]|nr:VWA domain-containing protein [Anaerolineae bacterium]